MEITRTTDLPAPQSPATRQAGALGCDTGFSLASSDYAVTYGFDAFGRFHSVSSSVRSMRPRSGKSVSSVVQYSRLPNSDLISGMTSSNGFLWTRAYESGRSLITSVSNLVNHVNPVLISAYDYANDELGRRTSIARRGLAFGDLPVQDACVTPPMTILRMASRSANSPTAGGLRVSSSKKITIAVRATPRRL
jgi:hypothetical protein